MNNYPPCLVALAIVNPLEAKPFKTSMGRTHAAQHNAHILRPPSTGAAIAMDGGVADTARANTRRINTGR